MGERIAAIPVPDLIVPVLILLYALATLDGPHRPAVLALAVAMIAVRAVRPRWAATLLQLLGAAAAGFLDGGVASPAGAMLPFALAIVALRTRPGPFAAIAAVAGVAYGAVALFGGPAPPGYALACTLGYAGLSYLCLRHAAALTSLGRRLARLSVTDPLTGALNRRGFDDRLETDFAAASRDGTPLTLVLADLDLFKQVNDRYGHQAGDQLLTTLATRLGRDLGAEGAVGRIGGDEFAVVLPGTGPEEAAALVSRLDADLPASIGLATFPADGATTADLRRIADKRLYQAKISRDRRPPSAAAVAEAAGEAAGSAPPVRVSARERRGRSFVDIGWMSMLGGGCGLLYALAFAHGRPHQATITLLAFLLWAAGAGFVLAAGRLSRLRRAREFIFSATLIQVGFIGGMAALDGGVTGVPALALLVPVPLIALSSPLRISVPVVALFASVYLAVAVLVGASSGWYVALHLGGTILVSLVCMVQGRAAGRHRRRLTELARMDALTEVLNRRGFGERCAGEFAGSGRTAALVIVDLDGFKQVNDRFGHEAGDELLRWVAATLSGCAGPGDAVGRLGGDEFVVLLTGASAADPDPVTAGIRTVLAARTGVSLGTAVLGHDGTTFDTLYAHADAALYADKQTRRTTRRTDAA
ncbi:diguanylate cyclase domain-containing protein [Actinoplanes sp. GCM10030250]|uniref:diguanylate cyclase domain-containing protein n=1 Tax=Actinoplanes sp. GCM10030250 TaxID=3273376 RepID=UPI00360E0817